MFLDSLLEKKSREREFFPVFLDIEKKNCLVIGAGKIAYRKIKTLMSYNGQITVVAPEISDEISILDGIEIIQRKFVREDLKGKFIVIAATDNRDLNSEIVAICNEKNILVNNITSKRDMNLSFASIIEGEEFKIGISGKGDPEKALEIREKIKKALAIG